ncbi:hypothetical protein [Flammeovirga kamogawensis]|uniref:Transporter n=1 Tax=Flammeovirga kamogawensis TaxID=373891 RepID=A0ABX8GQ76_9BACT|nr:hypothetical protein [Flammeovirga kamogawensis]MBB6463029.1 hypothetical protein [Flammeovirga kamogawensis]QWG05666.1 hypothetical protein KM029_09750 [Flammeovirga kamogawensis]TRX67496.1 hypothetical protein EO216_04785 [Flammeovirga kamogawensis]
MKKSLLVISALLISTFTFAQNNPTTKNSKQEMSVDALNPTAKIYKFIFMNNTSLGTKNTNTLYIEPAIPVNISKKIKLINFAMIPIDTRRSSDGSVSETSLGNIQYSANFTPMHPFKVGSGILAPLLGPAVMFNSNTYGDLKSPNDDSWNVGLNMGATYKNKGFLAVASYSPTWGVGGAKMDVTTVQYIFNYSFKSGTGINTSPLLMKNEGFEGEQKWLIPVGIGVSQIIKTKKAIFNIAVSAYYNAVRPDVMEDQKMQVQVKFYVMLPSRR